MSCLVRFCSSADGSLSAFLSRNAAFRQTKAFAFAPDICETRHWSLNATWSATFERLARFLGLSFRERLELVLRDLVTRFGVEEKRGVLIVPEPSQEDLAEMIGSSRPMVSKILADMTEERFLARGERHLILRGNSAARR